MVRIDVLAHRLGRSIFLRTALRTVQTPLRLLVAMLTRVVPRRADLYVFGAPLGRFGDNAAHLYLWMSDNAPNIQSIWITPSPAVQARLTAAGYRCELRWSARGIGACLRAGTYVYNAYVSDINRWLWRGARTVNLWHGLPVKRIERDITAGPTSFMFHPKRFRPLINLVYADELHTPSVLLAPSEVVARRCFGSAFDIDPDRCLAVGYPRNDHLVPPTRPAIVDLLPGRDTWSRLRDADFVVGYFPTWRDNHKAFLGGSGQLAVEDLADTVAGIGGTLVYKPHYNTDGPRLAARPGLALLDADDDVHAFVPLCDLLITDYSSLAFDFMILNRPILYFVPDFEEFTATRGTYFAPDECMPGPILTDPADLLNAVSAARRLAADERVAATADWLWQGNTKRAAPRILDALVDGGRASTLTSNDLEGS